MQVRDVKCGVVFASNGGSNAFDINRSLAESIVELNGNFSPLPLSALALSIIASQPRKQRFSSVQVEWMDDATKKTK